MQSRVEKKPQNLIPMWSTRGLIYILITFAFSAVLLIGLYGLLTNRLQVQELLALLAVPALLLGTVLPELLRDKRAQDFSIPEDTAVQLKLQNGAKSSIIPYNEYGDSMLHEETQDDFTSTDIPDAVIKNHR
ncbi:MAG: hypothetical protein SVY53_05515 [Chloroflexota bacterium]|nr:hypothetical protein [Chloroflexota bacterium]